MSSLSPTIPLYEALFPGARARSLAWQMIAGVAVLALLAQVRIPIGPVPFTGQTLGVLLIGAAYGYRRGALTMLLYLAVGGAGLPVFQGMQAGWGHLAGPTAGYLLGFPVAAATVGYLAQHGWARTPWKTALAMVVGNAVIYFPGLLWLGTFMPGMPQTLAAGLLPFLAGDLLKLLLAMALLPAAWRLAHGRDGDGREGAC